MSVTHSNRRSRKNSLPHSQKHHVSPYSSPHETSLQPHSLSIRSILILSSYTSRALRSAVFPWADPSWELNCYETWSCLYVAFLYKKSCPAIRRCWCRFGQISSCHLRGKGGGGERTVAFAFVSQQAAAKRKNDIQICACAKGATDGM